MTTGINIQALKALQDRNRDQHRHYHKSVEHLATIDVYRVLDLFEVTDPSLQHAIKKLLVAGGRGAGKDIVQDVLEAIDSCTRCIEMIHEDRQGKKLTDRCC